MLMTGSRLAQTQMTRGEVPHRPFDDQCTRPKIVCTRHFPGIRNIIAPLARKRMRGGFHMGPEQRHAVKAAKEALKKAMTLALPDPNQPFTLEVDASRTGFGAVLMQGDRPIHFASKQLSPTEAGLQVTLLELAATVWAQSPHLAAWCPVPLQEAGHLGNSAVSVRFRGAISARGGPCRSRFFVAIICNAGTGSRSWPIDDLRDHGPARQYASFMLCNKGTRSCWPRASSWMRMGSCAS